MFGKTVSQYLGFQKVVLAVIVLAWLVRLALSLAGTPNASAKWVSVTAVLLLGVLYYGVAVHTKGFGSYKQLYPLMLFQSLLGEGLVALAIVLAILTSRDNIYTAPEYSGGGDGKNWVHVVAHLVVGGVILPLRRHAGTTCREPVERHGETCCRRPAGALQEFSGRSRSRGRQLRHVPSAGRVDVRGHVRWA